MASRYEHLAVGNDPKAPVRADDQNCYCFRLRLGDFRLVLGAEIDCQDAKTGEFIELKTSRIESDERALVNYRKFKLLKFWIQSFLVGVPTIIVGKRDDQGKVLKSERLATKELPGLAKNEWNAHVCLNFAEKVLQLVTSCMRRVPEPQAGRVQYDPSSGLVSFIETLTDSEPGKRIKLTNA